MATLGLPEAEEWKPPKWMNHKAHPSATCFLSERKLNRGKSLHDTKKKKSAKSTKNVLNKKKISLKKQHKKSRSAEDNDEGDVPETETALKCGFSLEYMTEGVDHDFSLHLRLKELEEEVETTMHAHEKVVKENKALKTENEEYIEQIAALKYKMNMMEMNHQEMLIKQRKICMQLQTQNDQLSKMLMIKQQSLTEALIAVDQHTDDLVIAQGRNSRWHSQQMSVGSVESELSHNEQRKMSKKGRKGRKLSSKKQRISLNFRKNKKNCVESAPKKAPILIEQSMSQDE